MSFSAECYRVAALTQSIGVQCFEVDLDARAAIEQAFPLRTLLGKLRFGKTAKFKLSAEGAVMGGTALMTALYDAIRGDCFTPRVVLWQGRFEPRLEAFWSGLKLHPVLQHMQPPMPQHYSRYPIPRPDPNPLIVEGLNDFLVQLESRFAGRKFKANVADHQAVQTKRVARIRSRLEVLMDNYPATSWLSFSVWFGIPPGRGHASRESMMATGSSIVNKAIRTCIARRNCVSLLRPVFQRDEWVRIDVAMASPNVYRSECEVLARRMVEECERAAPLWSLGKVQLEAHNEADSYRIYTPGLGHWEAARRLAFYYGGANLAVSHGVLKDAQLFALEMDLLSLHRLGSMEPARTAWPFSHQVPFQPYDGPNGWRG